MRQLAKFWKTVSDSRKPGTAIAAPSQFIGGWRSLNAPKQFAWGWVAYFFVPFTKGGLLLFSELVTSIHDPRLDAMLSGAWRQA
jgi:hypothetical protein